MKRHQEFLSFNDELITYLSVDGNYWISMPSICKALKVDVRRSIRNAKNDPILGPAMSIQTVQVPGKGGSQTRKVTCVPEYLVYGWLFSLNSKSEKLLEYKRTCYQLLYQHFHGNIGNRKKLLLERKSIDVQIGQLKAELKNEDVKYQQLRELEGNRKLLSTRLNSIDKEILNQTSLFNQPE